MDHVEDKGPKRIATRPPDITLWILIAQIILLLLLYVLHATTPVFIAHGHHQENTDITSPDELLYEMSQVSNISLYDHEKITTLDIITDHYNGRFTLSVRFFTDFPDVEYWSIFMVSPTYDHVVYRLQKNFASKDENTTEIIQQALFYAADPNGTLSLVLCNTKTNQCWLRNGNYIAKDMSTWLISFATLITFMMVVLPLIVIVVLFRHDIRDATANWLCGVFRNRMVIVYVSICFISLILAWVFYWSIVGMVVSTRYTIIRLCMIISVFWILYILKQILDILSQDRRIVVFSVLSIFYFIAFGVIIGCCLNKVIPTVRSQPLSLEMLFIYSTLLTIGLFKVLSTVSSIELVAKKLRKLNKTETY
jgi:hypothetical protein